MTLRHRAAASVGRYLSELILISAVLVFSLVLRPPIEAGVSERSHAILLGLVVLLLVGVPGTLMVARFAMPRYWSRWCALSVVALLTLAPSLATYYGLRDIYSVDFEGRRVVVGDDHELTDLGRMHAQLVPRPSPVDVVRLTAGRPHWAWDGAALHRHAERIDRHYLVTVACAGLVAVGLGGVWRSRSRWRPAAESLPAPAAPSPTETRARRFRVALSFPGEVRERAEAIAAFLEPGLGRERVFYDRWYAPELARPDMDLYLQNIYRNESDLLVVMLCAEYQLKQWCGLEWRVVRDLVKARESDRIMYLRLDGTAIEGLLSIDGYLDVAEMEDQVVAEAIRSRVSATQAA